MAVTPVPESESAKVRRLMREWQARVLLEDEQPELTLTPEERQWVKYHVLMFAEKLGVARAIANAERARIREANPPQQFALPG